MKAVVQRVKSASLEVDGQVVSSIKRGLVVFLGVGKGDEEAEIELISKKIAKMRIFEDENGKMNKDLANIQGEILLVSQFTLFADCSHGNRPSFFEAEEPKRAKELYFKVQNVLESFGLKVKMGVFGADMQIRQHNDGPVTIILDSKNLQKEKV